jgi:hypothetical protein
MKHLKYLPFLIGAASYLPRVHAATAAAVSVAEPGTLSMVLTCLGLIVLSCAAGLRRSKGSKLED